MEEEIVQLKDLQINDVVRPRQSPLDFVAPANQLDDIINNTSIEDTVSGTEGALLDGTIAQRMQRLNDKSNTVKLLNREFADAEENIVRETQGRGITQLGRRNSLITNQRVLDSKRKSALAEVEDLRGNIETAERLRKAGVLALAKTDKERRRIARLTDEGLAFEEFLLTELSDTPEQADILRDMGIRELRIKYNKYPDTLTEEQQSILDFVDNRVDTINTAREGGQEYDTRYDDNDFLDGLLDFSETVNSNTTSNIDVLSASVAELNAMSANEVNSLDSLDRLLRTKKINGEI